MSKIAVVVFNLGGPDGPDAIRPFLFNLFMDPAILRMPALPRRLLAWWISTRRAPVARRMYEQIGGRSPILEHTRAQADALQDKLSQGDDETRVFVAMRHWHPFAEATAAEVRGFAPDRVILLPLYPQFSGTTTGSFLTAWEAAARHAGLDRPTSAICCYPAQPGLVSAIAALTRDAIGRAAKFGKPRVLFSAHGLPRKLADAGDPYQSQVERTVAAIAARLEPGAADYRLCYQSRVGRLQWLRPYTDDEIRQAAAAGLPLVVVPIAFVSEHSETLVELDLEYGRMARQAGAPAYERAATVGTSPDFIDGLAGLVRHAMTAGPGCFPGGGVTACAGGDCPAMSGNS